MLDYKKENTSLYVLLLSAPILLSIYYYHGTPSRFSSYFPAFAGHANADLYGLYWQFFCFFILMGCLPLLYARLGMNLRLSEIGLGFGDWKLGLGLVALLLPLVVAPLIWLGAGTPDIQAEYPMFRRLFLQPELFLRYEIAYVLLYYIAWEFYFRGFLLFGLAQKLGATNAILIQTISSCMIHLGKPESETMGSIAAGILFGILAWRTKSIWYVFLLHVAIGVLSDLFVLLQAGVRF